MEDVNGEEIYKLKVKDKDWNSKQMEIKGKNKHLHSHLVNQTEEMKGLTVCE